MSLFSEALKGLLDETNFFDHKEWAKFTGTTIDQVEQWLKDEAVPTSHRLNMVWIALEHSSNIPKELLEIFLQMAHLPAREVSPFGKLMLPTVWKYMKRPRFSVLANKLAPLSPEEQEEFLDKLFPPPHQI